MQHSRTLESSFQRLENPTPATDEALVDAVRAGCTAHFEELARRHNQRLFRAAFVLNDDEAEDVVQQAYVSVFEHLAQLAGHAKFSTWLTRIAVHEALARVRALATHRRRDRDFQAHGDGWQRGGRHDATPQSKIFQGELRQLLEVALDRLEECHRTVLVLRDVEGMSSLEVAECTGVRRSCACVCIALASKCACSWGARSTPPRRDLTPLQVNVARA
jgi:RNA polymerase sigma-70 factor (ECF subfamily)